MNVVKFYLSPPCLFIFDAANHSDADIATALVKHVFGKNLMAHLTAFPTNCGKVVNESKLKPAYPYTIPFPSGFSDTVCKASIEICPHHTVALLNLDQHAFLKNYSPSAINNRRER